MKARKASLHLQRRQLDRKLAAFTPLSAVPRPRLGWAKAVREALGISAKQLAMRLGISDAAVLAMEERETGETVSLGTLRKAARAMDCDLVYAIVPKDSLESVLNRRALAAARRTMMAVDHTMRLEDQGAPEPLLEEQTVNLAHVLKQKLDPELWKK